MRKGLLSLSLGALLLFLAVVNIPGLAALFSTAASTAEQAITTFNPPNPSTISCAWQTSASISFTWTASASPVSGYALTKGTTAGNQTTTVATISSRTTTSATDTSASGGQVYVLRSTAGSFSSSGASLADSSCQTLAPTAPTGLSATPSSSAATLSWTAVSSTNPAPVSSYKVYRNGTLIGSSNTNSYTDAFLTNGTSYTYYVVASGSGGDSPASNTATVTPTSVLSAPGTATLTKSGTSLTATWTAGVNATSYNAELYNVTTLTSVSTQTGLTALTANFTGLPGYTYYVNVYSVNPQGTSSPVTSNTVTLAPSAPTSLAVPTYTPTTATVSWSAAAGATSYQLTGIGSGCSTSSTSCAITGLTANTTYSLSLTATNSAGTSSAATLSWKSPPAQVTSATATSITQTTASITWSASTGAVSYNILGGPTTVTGLSTNSGTVTGLTPGTSYSFTIQAVGSTGTYSTSPSTALTIITIPPTPTTAPTFTSVTSSSVVVNVTAQTGATSYVVSGIGSGCTITSGTSCTITGLTSDTTYTVNYTAHNTSGTSSASPNGTVTTSALSLTQTVLSNSPVAYYRLGETSGTSAADSSGNNYTGTYNGSPALNQTSLTSDQTNGALGLTASSYMQASSSVPHATTAFTLEATIKNTYGSQRRFPISRSGGNSSADCEWWLEWDASNDLNFMFCDSTGASHSVGTSGMAADTTYHVVVTYDGTTLRMYLNGTQTATAAASGSMQNAGQPIIIGNIGAWVTGNVNWYTGLVDDVSVYNSVLSANDVGRHYRAQLYTQATPDPTNVLSYGASNFNNAYDLQGWHNESNASLARSATIGYDNNGSLQATATATGTMATASAVGTSGASATAGQLYTGSVYLKASTTNRVVTPVLYFYNSSGTILASYTGTAGTEISGTWLPLYAQGTAPAGTAHAALYVSVAGVVTSEVHYLDHAAITATTADSSISGNVVPDYFFNAQPTASTNEVNNAWYLYNYYAAPASDANPAITQDNTRTHAGPFSEKVSWSTNNGWKGIDTPISTQAGHLYQISMYVWVDRPITISTFGYPFGPSNGSYDDPYFTPTPGQWVKITRTSYSNSGSPNSYLYIRSPDPAGTFWVDDVSVVALN